MEEKTQQDPQKASRLTSDEKGKCRPDFASAMNGPTADGLSGTVHPPLSSETSPQGQEIDLIELAGRLWRARWFLAKVCGLAALVGLVIAFSLPKEYTTTVKLAPEMEDVSKKMNGLGGLAAMAGINLNASSGADAISPDLYPDVVQSTPFLLELFPVKVSIPESADSLSLYAYMNDFQRAPWWSYLIQAPFKVLGGVKGFFSKADMRQGDTLDPFHLTPEQEAVLQGLRNRIAVSVDKKTFILTVSVQMQNPVVSAEVTQIVLQKLQDYIIAYRTSKVKDDLAFTRKIFGEAREAYYKAQQAYAVFEDTNRNLISSSYRTEQERLKNEMTLTFNVYNSLAQKLEQDKLRVQEQTPVYTVIEPATIPLRATSPKKLLILIGCIFLSLLMGVGYLFVKDVFAEKNEMQAKKSEVASEFTGSLKKAGRRGTAPHA